MPTAPRRARPETEGKAAKSGPPQEAMMDKRTISADKRGMDETKRVSVEKLIAGLMGDKETYSSPLALVLLEGYSPSALHALLTEYQHVQAKSRSYRLELRPDRPQGERVLRAVRQLTPVVQGPSRRRGESCGSPAPEIAQAN